MLLLPHECFDLPASRIGGKARSLAALIKAGLPVPQTAVLPTDAYLEFVRQTGVDKRIEAELQRKDLAEARWEELWDAALRIRNEFLRTELPQAMRAELLKGVEGIFADSSLAVRSSGVDEDAGRGSFAGLHESLIDVRGLEAALDAIKLVWASLWSDAALLYRMELGLDPGKSAMAVVLQRFVHGEASGVVFTSDPNDLQSLAVEAVAGLNKSLVDGSARPHRLRMDRETMHIVESTPGDGGQPLREGQAAQAAGLAMQAEALFGSPQDVEFTIVSGDMLLLQSRPITTLPDGNGDEPLWEREDKRPWYRSLHRSYSNLLELRRRVVQEIIPGMDAEAERLGRTEAPLTDDESLADILIDRRDRYRHWKDVYWSDCIPLAHAVRLFGAHYNDVLKPADPFEFVALLGRSDQEAFARNQLLENMASLIRNDAALKERLQAGESPDMGEFGILFRDYVRLFGSLSCTSAWCTDNEWGVLRLLLRMAESPPKPSPKGRPDVDALERAYRNAVSDKDFSAGVLDLARDAYRLRDDDNLHLGRLEGLLLQAVAEGRKRLERRGMEQVEKLSPLDVAECLRHADCTPALEPESEEKPVAQQLAHQIARTGEVLRGQPAGPGLAVGPARVIKEPADLYNVQPGEILVCDTVDPNTTFAVPRAAGIVERRGGMLAHGAIIAREYGLPCVTGIPGAVERIETGSVLTVDGFAGEVRVQAAGRS